MRYFSTRSERNKCETSWINICRNAYSALNVSSTEQIKTEIFIFDLIEKNFRRWKSDATHLFEIRSLKKCDFRRATSSSCLVSLSLEENSVIECVDEIFCLFDLSGIDFNRWIRSRRGQIVEKKRSLSHCYLLEFLMSSVFSIRTNREKVIGLIDDLSQICFCFRTNFFRTNKIDRWISK